MRADAREEEARGLGRRERAARGVLEFSCSSLIGSRVAAVVVDHRAAVALLAFDVLRRGIFSICEHGKALKSAAGREVPLRSWEGILAPGTSTLLLVQCCDSGKQDPLGPLVVGDRPANGARWRVEVLAGFHTLDALDAKVREQKTKTKRARFYNPLQPLP